MNDIEDEIARLTAVLKRMRTLKAEVAALRDAFEGLSDGDHPSGQVVLRVETRATRRL